MIDVQLPRSVNCNFESLRIRSAFFTGSLILSFAITSSLVAQRSDPGSQSRDANYIRRVHFGDLVDIHVPGHLDLDWRGRMNPEGFLDGYDRIPKQIYGLCKTESEIAAEITSELAVQIRDPKTEVKIVDTSMRPVVTIDGAVAVPTRFQLRREARLIELITMAGGITDRSSGTITVFRPEGSSCLGRQDEDPVGRRSSGNRIVVEIADLLSGKAGSNLVIVSGDLVQISESVPVYIAGAVATQGRLEFRPKLTLTRAIDASGGLLKEAVDSRVMIFRRNAGELVAIPIDLGKVRSNSAEDFELEPYDIVDVPFKGRPPRKLPPIAESDNSDASDRAKFLLKIIE